VEVASPASAPLLKILVGTLILNKESNTMKSIFKSLRLINAGFLLGMAFCMWLFSEELEKKNQKSYESSQKFNDIYNHYKEKENTHA